MQGKDTLCLINYTPRQESHTGEWRRFLTL